MPEMSKRSVDDDLHHLEDGNGAGEVGIYKKFIACCIGEKAEKISDRKANIVHS